MVDIIPKLEVWCTDLGNSNQIIEVVLDTIWRKLSFEVKPAVEKNTIKSL